MSESLLFFALIVNLFFIRSELFWRHEPVQNRGYYGPNMQRLRPNYTKIIRINRFPKEISHYVDLFADKFKPKKIANKISSNTSTWMYRVSFLGIMNFSLNLTYVLQYVPNKRQHMENKNKKYSYLWHEYCLEMFMHLDIKQKHNKNTMVVKIKIK